jgi:hypothetical protein
MDATDIAVVGAGPFGLSIAAHLRGRGLDCRIIGHPMQCWLNNRPKGMLLKSAGFALDLYDPARSFTLKRFCEEEGIAYEDVGLPVRVETFCSYGISFQKRFVPDVVDEHVTGLDLCPEGFELQIESGRRFKARKVVLAPGIESFRNIPEPLVGLPKELLSHSAEHHDLQHFRNQEVVVFGGGSYAVDIAVLLHEAQTRVRLIARKEVLSFHQKVESSRPFLQRVCYPVSGLGAGWRSRLCADAPWLFRYLPDHIRLRTTVTPSSGWFMKERAAPVPVLLAYELKEARVSGEKVQLRLTAGDCTSQYVSADHVIAATGYKADVHRLLFLAPEIFRRLQLIGQTPRLSGHFESSIKGLYFAGPISSPTFGPVMRFAIGAKFASHRISRHLAR